ncbi:MAG: prepilin peptidase [Candidatus Lokiarchaeota archaeon]|nr:prepilin peptidase [Candidatus Lokiarchaeota archaeon]
MILNLNLSFYYSNIILIYCTYRDIKYRKISNKIVIGFLFISSLIVFTEDLGIYNNLFIFLLTKIFFLFFVFLFSLMLFCFKIIGGADGKLLIILAFLNPTKSFNFQWIFTFFFVFLFLYLLLMLVNFLLNNGLSGNNSYDMIHGLKEKLPILHKIFIILFYKFLDFSQINSYTDEKFILKSLNLFFNEKKEKFQILTQFRPPLVILILLTNNYILLNYFY